MTHGAKLADRIESAASEVLRAALVSGCALALIAAGPASLFF
ncbi:hypothetical protein V5F89_03715 [Pelagerythrobacter marensis]|uniref:Uncharacterized protein n=1 Tax=Pelagerythrobacter marensis TaxID=543877 RepID=A0ABZ2D4Q7_9SPHN